MALYLNNNNYQTQLTNSLIHSYNKNCFSDYEEAETTLINKTLLPGEIAIAYYYDPKTVYGLNALLAVGPLTLGAGNILFNNSVINDDIKTSVDECIADVNASINYLREDLYTELDNIKYGSDTDTSTTTDTSTKTNVLEIDEQLNLSITNLYILIHRLNSSINYNSDSISNLSHKLAHMLDDASAGITSYVNEEVEKLNDLLINVRESIPSDYTETINGFKNDVSFIYAYANADRWHEVEDNISYLKGSILIINEKLGHFKDNELSKFDGSIADLYEKYEKLDNDTNLANTDFNALLDSLEANINVTNNKLNNYTLKSDTSLLRATVNEISINNSKKFDDITNTINIIIENNNILADNQESLDNSYKLVTDTLNTNIKTLLNLVDKNTVKILDISNNVDYKLNSFNNSIKAMNASINMVMEYLLKLKTVMNTIN